MQGTDYELLDAASKRLHDLLAEAREQYNAARKAWADAEKAWADASLQATRTVIAEMPRITEITGKEIAEWRASEPLQRLTFWK